MTRQEIFNKSWRHIHEQGAPAINDELGCVYWDPRTMRSCAVGGLLTQKQREKWSTVHGCVGNLRDIVKDEDPELADFLGDNFVILSNIQRAHDEAAAMVDARFLSVFEDGMREVAHACSLKVPA